MAMVHGLPNYPTALEKHAFEVQVKLLLNLPDNPTVQGASVKHNCLVLGIVGMGEMGKTTIAKKVFNNISGQFEYTCFVDNVKGIKAYKLKDWIFSHFLRNGTKVDKKTFRWSHLQNRKTLMVVDDLDHQVRTWMPSLDQFGKGSWLIFTSRDHSVFNSLPNRVIYEVDFLSFDEAKKLFCQHAS